MILVLRTILLYSAVVLSLRLMGKRQIGELQPSELVMTLLISEIAAIPMEDENASITTVAIPLATLIIFELLVSLLSIKSVRFRNLLQGNSIIIIRNGVVDQKQLRKLRFSMEDLLEELRKKDVFDISNVQYAIAETDGTISVLQNPEIMPVTPSDLNLDVVHDTIPITVIDDGVIIEDQLCECDMTREKLLKVLEDRNLDIKRILLMEMTSMGNTTVIIKE